MKGVVIGGVSSGAGKTLVSLIVELSLIKEGLRVQPFKVGPDYIDPSLHERATGRPGRNLDWWIMGKQGVAEAFSMGMEGADIGVVEGVMGLFDGMEPMGLGSTYHIAEILDLNIILVVDARGISQSSEAILKGFAELSRGRVKGVVFNRVGGLYHRDVLIKAAEKLKLRLCGLIPRDQALKVENRHLGLFMAHELNGSFFRDLWEFTQHIDTAGILELAKPARLSRKKGFPLSGKLKGVTVALALDEAFSFFYRTSMDALELSGCKVKTFSPIRDRLPDSDLLILPGGYPELYADRLNRDTMKDIRCFQGPIYAECGGLIYLSKEVIYRNSSFEMTGLIPAKVVFGRKPVLGYALGLPLESNPFAKKAVKGHMFHYSYLEGEIKKWGYRILLPGRKETLLEGPSGDRYLATYLHTDLYFNPHVLEGMVKALD